MALRTCRRPAPDRFPGSGDSTAGSKTPDHGAVG